MNCKLLTITDDYVGVPSPEATQIEVFRKIIERDDSENKIISSKELAYIYYMVDWESPYQKYEDSLKQTKIVNDLFDEDWEPDDLVLEGLKKYKELYANDYTMMLDSAREGARKLREYFEDVDLTERDDNNKLVHKSTDLMRNLKDVGSIVEGLQKLVELVKKNQAKENQNRGNIKTNKYSEG